MTKHLDLGCGKYPRNPYDCKSLYGVDIIEPPNNLSVNYTKCNIALENLPFQDSFFDSVSAYDFLEHIPRVYLQDGESKLPFIHAMNEIFRVLKPNGRLLAITPAFPKPSAFVDPTHVNVITDKTHKYFTSPDNWGQMYGFCGEFDIVRVGWCNFEVETNEMKPLKRYLKKLKCLIFSRLQEHFLWEFTADKKDND